MNTIEMQNQLNSLKRKVTFLTALAVILLLALVRSFFYGQTKYDTITVRKIDLADDKDRARLTIATPLPNPVVQGTEYPRSTNVYGFQFKDSLGNEVGGLGIEDNLDARMLCFDYETAEAMCFIKYKGAVGINMFNEPSPDTPIGQTASQRIAMGVSNADRTALLVLFDNNGKERIKFSVDSTNVARIQMFDAEGNVTYSIPE